MTAIATWLIGRGLAKTIPGAERLARILVAIGVALAIVAIAIVALKIHDRNVIDRHETEERAAADRAALEGERKANAAELTREKEFQAQQDALTKGSDHEIEQDPEGARRPVGPGQRGYFDGLPDRRPSAAGR